MTALVANAALSGWGAHLRSPCVYTEIELPSDLGRVLDRSGTIARGLGRSYGDPALNTGGQVLGMARVDAWKEIEARADPDRVFVSDLGRRLGLTT